MVVRAFCLMSANNPMVRAQFSALRAAGYAVTNQRCVAVTKRSIGICKLPDSVKKLIQPLMSALKNLESGKGATLKTLIKILRALGRTD